MYNKFQECSKCHKKKKCEEYDFIISEMILFDVPEDFDVEYDRVGEKKYYICEECSSMIIENSKKFFSISGYIIVIGIVGLITLFIIHFFINYSNWLIWVFCGIGFFGFILPTGNNYMDNTIYFKDAIIYNIENLKNKRILKRSTEYKVFTRDEWDKLPPIKTKKLNKESIDMWL